MSKNNMGNVMEGMGVTSSSSTASSKRKRTELSSSMSWKVDAPIKLMDKGGDELWIGDLPPELLQLIFRWVSGRDLVKVVPLVCKFWNKHANEPMIWMDLCTEKGLDASVVPGGVQDWRRFFFTPNFNLVPKNNHASVTEDKRIIWKGQGTVVSSNELPAEGIVQWQVRVVRNAGASWVCFGIMEPKHVSPFGDGDWMPSYSFCTCCDGYPKGRPRWTGQARGKALAGDVFTCTADMNKKRITIVGPRGVNMNRELPPAKYVLYFTVSTSDVELAIEKAFYYNYNTDNNKDNNKDNKDGEGVVAVPPVKKRREAPAWKDVMFADKELMTMEEMFGFGDTKIWIGDLPPELLSMIISWVPPKDIVRVVPLVCKLWYNCANADQLWQELCKMKNLNAAVVPGGVNDWRRFYFTPNFTFQAKTPSISVNDKMLTWKGQGTAISSEEIPMDGITQWQVRIIKNEGPSIWVCFGLLEPHLVRGDGDWMPSYSFCTCCDGYPKGQPRWTGQAQGAAQPGDVFTLTVDRPQEKMTIVGPRGINMTRKLPAVKYIMYFTVSSRRGTAELVVENVFHTA